MGQIGRNRPGVWARRAAGAGTVGCLLAGVFVPALPAATGAGGAERLSKREFLEAGNAICAAANDELRAYLAQLDAAGQAPRDDLAGYSDGVLAILRPALAELRDLRPPKRDAKKVKRILEGYDDAFDAIEADPDVLLEMDGPFKAVDRRASRYGLTDCGGKHQE